MWLDEVEICNDIWPEMVKRNTREFYNLDKKFNSRYESTTMYRSFFPLESQAYVQISSPWIERDLETRLNHVDERLLFTPKLRERRTGHYLFAGEGTVLIKFIWSPHEALSYSYDPPHSGSQFLYSLLYTELIYLI